MKMVDSKKKAEIPKTAFVPCPMKAFANVCAAKCPECQWFKGVVDSRPGGPADIPFISRYRIFCAHPIARRMIHVEV